MNKNKRSLGAKKPGAKKPEETKAEEKKPENPKPEEPRSEDTAKKGKNVGRELNIALSNGAKFKGLCTGERTINGGKQVFLRINGCVSRYFSVKDIVK